MFTERASLAERTFLYRVIDFRSPQEFQLRYSGWWFRQTVQVSGITVWSKISWLDIDRTVRFSLPESIDPHGRDGRIEIDFSRGLQIRRFRVWIDDQLIYDEVT
ncbi:hypothetical protein [Roseiconus lacunae]|uniref:Uncharacterized protein n=1 Tax=Roseiconus lacunae TaxID=2605694 RepID=A0ABT7PPK1_9BACT|nr:hypothetical protein [Roseiconus lacunae]MCD0458954.1 hypothetical protein [Roseiconus lacunae]MDM4018396.1 hypothetical protein [Roseiconus lacunae]WRQ49264.1 hypothetical protein U8335_20175 [Stieleria sp. HD01]